MLAGEAIGIARPRLNLAGKVAISSLRRDEMIIPISILKRKRKRKRKQTQLSFRFKFGLLSQQNGPNVTFESNQLGALIGQPSSERYREKGVYNSTWHEQR